MVYCDTSALAKYYVTERQSESVRTRLDNEEQVFLCEIAKAELAAAFHRRLRERKWTNQEFQAVIRQFLADDLAGYWTWLPLDSSIIKQAVQAYSTLPHTVFLRSADCLHLITALSHGFAEIYTYDVRQAEAARALGLQASLT
jgi:predicted nucleic acid-binding protein